MAAPPTKIFFYVVDLQLILVFSLLFLTLTCYISFLWRKRHMFIKSWNYPGPFNFPVIGAAYKFMCRPEYIYSRITHIQAKYPRGGKLWFGNRLVYFFHEPEHIEKILGSTRLVEKELLYKHLVDGAGEGLLMARVPRWKKHRKAIMPSFNQKILDSFVEVFAERSEVLCEVLAERPNQDLDIYNVLSRCTLDILCETAMGLRLNIQRDETDIADTLDKIMKLVFLKIFQIWNHNDFIWKILGYDKLLKGYQKKLFLLTDRVIKEKMEAVQAKKNQNSTLEAITEEPKKRLAFLDYIIESKQFDAIELRDEVNMFIFAGTDTTASSLSFIVATIGMFPDVQQKVYEEVMSVIGRHKNIDYQDLPKLEYTERVIKEGIRLFPVGGFFLRAITEDVDMGDFVVPKGSSAYFGTVFIQRNPKYWPDPLKFDPDRFLPEEVAKRHPCTYIPFSYGPRNCIGKNYGMMTMKVIVASVVRKFKIHCRYKRIEEIKLKANIVLRFRDGAKVSVTPREEENV